MKFNLWKIRIFVWLCLLSISTWWGSKSVIRYWNQPLSTNIVYSFGDNEKGIQFPIITFCDNKFVFQNTFLKECKNKSGWETFIDVLTNCLMNRKTFKMSTFMNSLLSKRKDIINITRFMAGPKNIELQHFEDKLWSRVFNPSYGPCQMFDLSKMEKLKYIPYQGLERPVVDFLLSDNITWENLRILLHTKFDLPDAFQLNGRIPIEISKELRKWIDITIRKKISKRESTRKVPCNQYEHITCQNIEDNKLVLDEYNCQLPPLHYGQHLDNLITEEIPICSDENAKKAINLISSKISNCTRAPTCKMTRFTYTAKKMKSKVKDTNGVQIKFSNPEVVNYYTYISYDLPSLIGEVGGILGLTLGVSVLTFLETLLKKVPYY